MLPQQLQDELLIIKKNFKNYSQYSIIELEVLKEKCIKLEKKLHFYYEKTVALLTQCSSEYNESPIFAQEIQKTWYITFNFIYYFDNIIS